MGYINHKKGGKVDGRICFHCAYTSTKEGGKVKSKMHGHLTSYKYEKYKALLAAVYLQTKKKKKRNKIER